MSDAILERLQTEAQLAENGGHPILRRSFDLAIAEIGRLRTALREVEEWADDHADVDDGRPNDAMRVLVTVRTALHLHKDGGR